MRRLGLLAAAMLCATASPRAAEIASCGNCHGEAGASVDPEVPIIAGLSAAYVTANMTAYRNKERTCHAVAMTAGDRKGATSDMCAVMHDLGAADMKPIGAYFARQTFVPARQAADAALAAAGRQIHQQKCAPCHSAGGSAARTSAGALPVATRF